MMFNGRVSARLSTHVSRSITSQTIRIPSSINRLDAKTLTTTTTNNRRIKMTTSKNKKVLTLAEAPCRRFGSGGSVSQPRSDGLTEFLLADIGEGIAEVEIMQWFVKPGDTIQEFDRVCEVQSDKATVEITSRYEGVVKETCYKAGEIAYVGKPLILLQAEGGAEVSSKSDPPPASSFKSESPRTTDSSAVAARFDAGAPAQGAQAVASTEDEGGLISRNGKVVCSPAVRRLARERGIDLRYVNGSGPKGRIMKEDLNGAAASFEPSSPPVHTPAPPNPVSPVLSTPSLTPVAPQSSSTSSSTPPPAAPQVTDVRSYEYLTEDVEIPIKGLQRIMVQTMQAANEVPTLTYCEEVEMDELIATRAALLPSAQHFGLKLSFLPFIIKATSMTLMHYPSLNAHTTPGCATVVQKSAHNIGIAMDTPRGLMVPNIKNVQHLSILQIASELNRLAALGQEAKLGSADLQGGTFTLSNIGAIGGTYASPILVVPEVVIGALGKTSVVPRYDDNMQLQPRRIMNVSWSADHRVVEGATIARFVKDWKGYLETPASMLLHSR